MPVAAARAPDRPPATATPIAFARAIVAAYRRYGRAPDEALRAAQITPAQLRQPQGRMTARQMELLSAAAMQELDDEGLGAFSRRLPWGSYGMLARASLTAPDLGVALRRWCRHHGLLVPDLRLALASSGELATISLLRAAAAAARRARAVDRLHPAQRARAGLLVRRFAHPAAGRQLSLCRAPACRRLRAHVPRRTAGVRRRRRAGGDPLRRALPGAAAAARREGAGPAAAPACRSASRCCSTGATGCWCRRCGRRWPPTPSAATAPRRSPTCCTCRRARCTGS